MGKRLFIAIPLSDDWLGAFGDFQKRCDKEVRGSELRQELEKEGVHIQTGSISGLAEEAPLAYKDVRRVVDVVAGAGIAKKVAELKPLAVIKG